MFWIENNDTDQDPVIPYIPGSIKGSIILDPRNYTSYGVNVSGLSSPLADIGNVTTTSPSGMGSNVSYKHYPNVKQTVHMIIIYSIAYSIIFLLGIIGNSLVVSVVYRNARMHTVTNYFIVNLAIADILVCLFCLPITLLSNLYTGWRFGAAMCKVTPFLQGVAVSASVNTLTAIALDRYLAICHTLSFKINRRTARIMVVFIWLMAGGIMAPWAVYYQQEYYHTPNQTISMCTQQWPLPQMERGYFLGAIFLTCYTIPLVFISACYTMIGCRVVNRKVPGIANMSQVIQRSKVKVLKMLICVVILFAFSWLPLYAVQVRVYFGPQLLPDTQEFNLLSQIIMPISQWLGSSNSCVNPIIYCFFSKKFRHGMKALVHCGKRSIPVYITRNNSTTMRSGVDEDGHAFYSILKKSGSSDKRTPVSKGEITFF